MQRTNSVSNNVSEEMCGRNYAFIFLIKKIYIIHEIKCLYINNPSIIMKIIVKIVK